MLTGPVHTCKWFLMKDTAHSMAAGNLFKDTHHHLVLVCCDVDRCIDRCKFMLCRSNLIMLCLGRDTKFPAFFVYFFHICGNSLTDTSEIMVIHLLSLRRHSTEQCSACVDQVFSLKPFFFIYQEIFLLCTYGWSYFLGSCISKKSEQTEGLGVDRFHRTEQRCLLVKCFSCIGTKCSRNTECSTCCIMTYKCR